MKWKKVAEFLPEKTFLIIKDDLDSLREKEVPVRRLKPKSALDTGTWPPKVKNHHPHQKNRSSGERPKTANLERPSVLDPRLLNKLDMSLVSKELLCDSMMRLHQSVKNRYAGGVGRGARNARSSGGGRRRQSVPVPEKSYSIATSVSRKPHPSPSEDDDDEEEQDKSTISLPVVFSRSRNLNENSFNSRVKRSPDFTMDTLKKESPLRRNVPSDDSSTSSRKRVSEIKRLDDNNNKNSSGSSNATKISTLSSVKKNKGSKNNVTEEIEVFTGVISKSEAPEPCKTCGRPDQPERFHSHPKSSVLLLKKDKDTVLKPKVAVPKTIQKPVALNFRSEMKKKNKVEEDKEQIPKNENSKDTSPRDQNQNKSRQASGNPRKGPRTVTCYICAREFGTASFPIHEPKCMQKWVRENNSLPPSQRRAPPQRPVVPVDHYEWNNAAWEQSQAQLVPCWKCGRTFLPDRLEVHARSCKTPRKTGSSVDSSDERHSEKVEEKSSRTSSIGTMTVACQICGRNFGTRSIKIHEPQCAKKWKVENENQKKTKPTPRIERSAEIYSKDRNSSTVSPTRLSSVHKPTTTCYICGRDFGSASIDIHEPQCLRKWQNENSKLPAQQQREEPRKPEIIFTTGNSPTGSPVIDWSATSEARWKSHLGQLVPCKHCKRTFYPDRVVVHERSCKGVR